MRDVLTALSVCGLLGSGVIAGVFFAFSSFVMGALGRRPPLEGLQAMQSINVVVLNWRFLGAFIGTAVISAAVVVLALMEGGPAAGYLVAGGVLYVVGTFVVTAFGNVPLNEALAKVSPSDDGAAEAWRRYARRWTSWNHARTLAAALAALSFCVGLLQPDAAAVAGAVTPREQEVDRSAILAAAKGANSRVVVIPTDGAPESVVVDQLTAWKDAGTGHVLPLDADRPESAAGLFRLADVIELAGPGPHSVVGRDDVRLALDAARARGAIVVGGE